MRDNKITVRSFVLGTVICIAFAILTVYFGNIRSLYITSTQIPVLPYVLLFLTVLVVNPICRLVRFVKPFATAEILIIFTMGVVSAGISTFGLSAQVVPLAGGLFNKAWSTPQTKWNQHLEPFINDEFFVAEDGIRAAAREYRVALLAAAEIRATYGAALALVSEEQRLSELRRNLEAAAKGPGNEADRARTVDRIQTLVRVTEKGYQTAVAEWEKVKPDSGATPQAVTDTYSDLLRERDAAAAEAGSRLGLLEEKAFAKVDTLRRGLPREFRAFPGFVPTTDDSFRSYSARLRRFLTGMRSAAALESAREKLDRDRESAGVLLETALRELSAVSDGTSLVAEKLELSRAMESDRQQLAELDARMETMHGNARAADKDDRAKIADQIERLAKDKESLLDRQKELTKASERLEFELGMIGRIDTAAASIRALSAQIRTIGRDEADARLADIIDQHRFFDASVRRFVFGDTPWSHWVKPLAWWGLLVVLTYVVLMTFNVLIFRQWAHNEKLVYPLAELPEHLAGATSDESGLPYVFRSGLFWAGLAISASFLGWNLLCRTGLVPGLKSLDLVNLWTNFITGTKLEGLAPRSRSEIFFTMIGLSFLIPKKISFSLWFFSVVAMIELLVLVWTGHGVNMNSFPADWCYTLNYRTAQGGGALLVFSAVVLFKCRKYILCCCNRSAIDGLESDEQTELRVSSFLFLAGSIGIFLILWRGMGANVFHTLFFMIVILLITIGLIRAVTEGGILGFQAWTSPFHFIKSVTGMNRAWTSPHLFAPLMVYYGVLFFDIKTFIAPAMANALKVRSDLKMKRSRFHLAMFLAIGTSALVAVLAEIMMSYSIGGDLMSNWFHTGLPKELYGKTASMAQTPPIASAGDTMWIVVGAAAMVALLYFRQFLFWIPHPIGMIMLVNPIMAAYWFSILIGWIAKSAITKYGNKDLYSRIRCLFFGLIAGELIIVALSMVVSYMLDVNIPIDLNRNQ